MTKQVDHRPGYESAVIYEHAFRLLKEARHLARNYAVGGSVIGIALLGGLGSIGRSSIPSNKPDLALIAGVIIGLLLGAYVGWRIGWERAFTLRVRAQSALCQVQVEEHLHALAGTIRSANAASRAERQSAGSTT